MATPRGAHTPREGALAIGDWQQCNDGLFDYWWNTQTDETQWELPAELQHLLPKAEQVTLPIVGNGLGLSTPQPLQTEAPPGSSDSLGSASGSVEVQKYLQQVEAEKAQMSQLGELDDQVRAG